MYSKITFFLNTVYTILGAMTLDPLLVSCLSYSAVAVGSKCRPIRLLSGAVPLYAATIKLLLRTDYLISARPVCRDTTHDLIFSPGHLPENGYPGHLLTGLC